MEEYKNYSDDDIEKASLEELAKIIDDINKGYEAINNEILTKQAIIDEHQSYVEKLNDLVFLVNKVKQELFGREKNKKNKRKAIDEVLKINEMIQSTLFINSSLDNLLFDLKIRYNNNKINSLANKVNSEFDKKIGELTEKVESQEGELKKDAEDQISAAEKKVFNNSMTYMSILAALIAIIVSVISTSSSWLNNANNSSVIVAFVTPTLVLLFAITFLLSFSGYLFANEKGKKKIFLGLFVGVAVCIVLFSLILFTKVYSKSNEENEKHTYYIIDSNDYQINDNMIEFSFEGMVYSFTYDETLLHNGKLKYCIEHNKLE